MTKLKVGDAVMTPHGVAEVVYVGPLEVSVLRAVEVQAYPYCHHQLTRLVPDTGLEDRVREVIKKHTPIEPMFDSSVDHLIDDLENLLDTPEAEPEDEIEMPAIKNRRTVSAEVGKVRWAEPPELLDLSEPPPAAATREELIEAVGLVTELALAEDVPEALKVTHKLRKFSARLRGEEDA